jgi:OOP family OmpA-OmpF porin
LRRLTYALSAFVCLLATSSTAFAQPARPREPLDIERFKPHVTYDGFVMTEGSAVRPEADRWQVGAYINYSLNPLITVNQDDELVDRFVGHRLGFDVLASATLFGPVALGVGVPFFLYQDGDEDPDVAGFGDIRIVPKLRILDDRELFGLGLVAELRVPTHAGDFSGGARNVVFAPRLIADHRFWDTGFRIGANAGVAFREKTTFENVTALSEYVYTAAASYRFGGWDGIAAIGAEVNGGVGLTDSINLEELPLEGTLFAKINPTKEWEVSGGPGVGLIPGYGIPTFRGHVGIRWSPTENDRDGDGIPDDEDACPDEPEDRDGFEDTDGCPEDTEVADDDKDGIPNIDDACPQEKETINGIEDEDGCPDKGDAKVIRKAKQLVILENIEFATGSANIRPVSYPILNQVALMMQANPDITKVSIGGHTDSRGGREMNVVLSQARAESVRRYLMMRGVKSGRLAAKGYGPDKPLVDENTDEDRQKNRRVEFLIDKQ